MIIKPRGTVTIPARPRSLGGVLKWCRGTNQALQQLRDRAFVVNASGGGRGGDTAIPCAFGEVISYTAEEGGDSMTGIRGGLFVCGDKNFSVPNKELDLDTDGKWFIQIKLTGVKATTDDDEQIFLPGGVKTATGTPTWDAKTWADGGNYDDTTNPTAPTASGALVIPIGILEITDGAYKFEKVGCGKITATQCAGILGHTRGEV